MKFTINIDCTPEEARTFFGFPDLSQFQSEMNKKLIENLGQMDPESLMKHWMPMGLKTAEMMQKSFFSAMGTGGTTSNKE